MRCIIENAGSNYSAYLDGLDGVVTTGRSIDEIKVNMAEAIAAYKEANEELGFLVPDIKVEELEFVLAE